MTTGWLVINIVLAITLSALVAGVAVLVPRRLHRNAMRRDPAYAQYHGAPPAFAKPQSQRRDDTRQRHREAA